MTTGAKTYRECRAVLHKGLSCLLVFALVLGLCASGFSMPSPAYAITENTEAELTETQRRIEETAAAYDKAIANLAVVNHEIEETQARISELEAVIAAQQKKSDGASISLYKWFGDGYTYLSLLFDSGSFTEYISSFEYLTRVQKTLYYDIKQLNDLKKELEETKDSLVLRKQFADIEIERADEALRDARLAREEAQRKAEAEARAEAEAAALAIALALAQAEKERQEKIAQGMNGGLGGNGELGDLEDDGNGLDFSEIDWDCDKETFVEFWGARIDAYMAGFPLAGYGRVFAAAAWDYGIDPRYSPAISCTESTKGKYCFLPYNAWGWGNYSWSSWEEAIYAHVRGLSRGYSYSICIADAKKYCPPNWEFWYTLTLSQMKKI